MEILRDDRKPLVFQTNVQLPPIRNLRFGFWCEPSTHDPRNHFRNTKCRSDPLILTMMPFTNINFSPEHKGSYLCPQNLYTTNSVMTTTLAHQSNDLTHCVCLAESVEFESTARISPSDGLANRWFNPLTQLSI